MSGSPWGFVAIAVPLIAGPLVGLLGLSELDRRACARGARRVAGRPRFALPLVSPSGLVVMGCILGPLAMGFGALLLGTPGPVTFVLLPVALTLSLGCGFTSRYLPAGQLVVDGPVLSAPGVTIDLSRPVEVRQRYDLLGKQYSLILELDQQGVVLRLAVGTVDPAELEDWRRTYPDLALLDRGQPVLEVRYGAREVLGRVHQFVAAG